jgi:hypothetical protein
LHTPTGTNYTSLSEVRITGTQNKVINNSRTGSQEIITRNQIDRLPTINRSISDYTKLTPSASSNGSFGGRNGNGNNVTVDGALFNNSFGLSGTLGGQTNSQPISLDAIEQIQVAVNPFDVTQGRFAGSSVNTVTKSGTNEFKGTVYLYKRTAGLVGLHALTADVAKPTVNYTQRGISLGGPIIKNKLFLFVSGEQERISDPATSFTALRTGQVSGGSVSQATYDQLNDLKDYLQTTYKYNAGDFENYQLRTRSDKVTAKLDWNINKNNTLSLKYFYLKSLRDVPPSSSGAQGSRSPGLVGLPFFSSYYTINNNFNIGIAELNTRISSKFANKLTVGYQALRDFRSSPGGGSFPLVDILNPAGTGTLTSFGYEPFTANNLLNTNTFQASDNFTYFAGKHEINIGLTSEFNSYKNGFAPNYNGLYRFNSIDDFKTGKPAVRYALQYSALPDGSFPFAVTKAYTIGFYLQDKWQATDNFKLIYGVRLDMPGYNTDSQFNSDAANLTGFRDGYKVNTAQFPKAALQISPRVGFNWNVNGEGLTQVRGGAGIFQGPVPYVYISNQASNNGVQFGSYTLVPGTGGITLADPRLIFNPNVNANRPVPTPGTPLANTSYNLAITAKDFKFPSNVRVNIGVDQKLPFGIIGTLEGSYSKDLNAIIYQNIALPTTGTALVGSDNRIRYSNTTVYPALSPNTAAAPNITDAILLTNTKKGYAYNITGQLQRTFKDLYFMVAYTYSDSRSVNDGGSIAQSTWRDRVVSGDPNADVSSYASFRQPNRVIAAVSYKKAYLGHLSTSVGLTYEAANAGVTSYVYSGDVNGDGQTSNDLIYIPRDANDILLVKDNATDPRTIAQSYSQLNAYISQDPYLSKRRGKYAERNGLTLPYFHLVNFNFTQDLYQTTGKIKNTLQFEFNIINLGNFLYRNWGNFKFANRNLLLTYKGIDAATGKPAYSFPYFDNTNQVPLTTTFGNGVSQASRWQAQFGLRYIFN